MLDRVDAVLKRDFHTLGALDMRRDLEAELMSAVAGGSDKLGRHPEHAGLADLLGVKNSACDHQLDDVRLFLRDNVDIVSGFLRS